MSSIDHNGDGVMDMLPDETRAYLKTVQDAGEAFGVAWRNARGIIEGADIGNGEMGRKFMENYQPNLDGVKNILDQVPELYRTLTSWGYEAVQNYQSADAQAAQEFPPA